MAALLRSYGYEARRSQQYQGVSSEADSADIIHSIPGIRIEVKLGYDTAELGGSIVAEWIERAWEETPEDDYWCILWRKTRKKWMIIFPLDGMPVMSAEPGVALKFMQRSREI